MEKTNKLEERISQLERRLDHFDKIWLFVSWIGLTIPFLLVVMLFADLFVNYQN